ncbi:MAG: sulfatase-like hydrolase/transferase [Candidatus Lokiarchaeota archaeon]|nr:sulfatase-like hydrolase/transferase [Candidatus Lokiarchaeota archaeon]MBD3337461.1 sulfatase-like hydrolase/transferase [Candidatus Lokiarchaeota archaeon]
MKNKPNFVIIMPDQHRADVLGCAGTPVKTPNIDKLAEEGVRFQNAFTQSPLCVPTRAAFLVGRYVHETKTYTNKNYIHESNPELIKWSYLKKLQEKGYFNVDIGKMHLVKHFGYDALHKAGDKDLKIIDHVENHYSKMYELGFDECHEVCGKMETAYVGSCYMDALKKENLLETYHQWAMKYPIIYAEPIPLPKELYIDYFVGDLAVKWINDYAQSPKSDNPFCLLVGFPGPHDPFDCVEEYRKLYDSEDIKLEEEAFKEAERPLPRYVSNSRIISRSKFLTKDYVKRSKAAYYANVTLIDEKVGEIRRALEENDLLDNTWIIYTSDHGEQLGDHKLFMKFVFYRSSVQVPLIIRPPKGMEGKIVQNDVELLDITTTLYDLLNINTPPNHRGKSLLPFLKEKGVDENYKHKEIIISQVSNYAMGVTEDWKFVVDSSTGKLLELYDRNNDFYENNNLSHTDEGQKIGNELYQRYFEDLIPKVEVKEGMGL